MLSDAFAGPLSETLRPARRRRNIPSSPPTLTPSSSLPPSIPNHDWQGYEHPRGTAYFVKRTTHPEGNSYFANATTHVVTPDRRETLGLVDERSKILLSQFEQYMHEAGRTIPKDWELWIELQGSPDGGNDAEGYDHGFMDHDTQAVLHVRDQKIFQEGSTTYWRLFSQMPMHHALPPDAEQIMLSSVAQFGVERLIYEDRCKSPFKLDQCMQLISLGKTLEQATAKNPGSAKVSGARSWYVSVLMYQIWCVRKTHGYATANAEPHTERLKLEPRSFAQHLLDAILFIFCFGAHERYRERLQRPHTKVGPHVGTFQKILEGTIQEWKDSNLLSTVFVLANMAFLALVHVQRTQRAFSLVSIMFSMASIVLGSHHLWKHQPKMQADVAETRLYLRSLNSTSSTIQSISLSLPLVCLVWSVLSFSVALLHFSFRDHRGASLDMLAFFAAVIIITLFFVRAFFYRIWDEPDKTSIFRRTLDAFYRFRNRVKKRTSATASQKNNAAARQSEQTADSQASLDLGM